MLSIFSLAVVTPIVAFYLVYDWNRMIAAIDNWVPPARRDTVRALAREVDDTISGFVRGQSALCLVLAAYYALALLLIGLKHGLVIGFAAGLMSFIPYLGSLSGLVISTCVATRNSGRTGHGSCSCPPFSLSGSLWRIMCWHLIWWADAFI